MPLYEYRCNDCRRRVSILIRSFSETPPVTYPNCGSTNLRRLFSSFAIHDSSRIFRDEINEDIAEIQHDEFGNKHSPP